jgi:hypothetical protein
LAKRFQGKNGLKSTNKKQELPMTAIFVNGSKWNEQLGRSSIEIAHFDPLTNMAATGNSCFRLVDFYEYSSLKLLGQSELKFGGKHL